MATYKYSAVSRGGERVSGVVEGYNEMDAVRRIKETCDIVLKVREVNENKEGILNMELGGPRLDAKAFTVMCDQFAIILRSGIPIARTVHLVADKTTDKHIKRILKQVAEDVEAGRSLAESFRERGGRLLPQTFIETIRAGEESGNVDASFATMAEHFDKQTKMRSRVMSALSYPLFVMALAVVVVIVLMVFVVPKFTSVFADMGSELPFITRMLIGISDFFRKYMIVIAAVIAALIIGVKLYGNTENGRLRLARLALKAPVFGNINELNGASQFSNSMVAMLSAGIPMTKALSITAKVLDNYHLSREIGALAGKVEEGRSLGASMREAGCMPDILTDMVAVGEETGEMEETLRTISGYYDNELETAIDAALKKLEPTLLVGLAAVAGFIVIAIYMAMFSMYDVL